MGNEPLGRQFLPDHYVSERQVGKRFPSVKRISRPITKHSRDSISTPDPAGARLGLRLAGDGIAPPAVAAGCSRVTGGTSLPTRRNGTCCGTLR